MMIDAHQHFWRVARADYGWLKPDLAPLYRDYGPADLEPLLTKHGIAKTILVQAAETVAETDFLLDVARDAPFVAGVVGWVDFEAPDVAATIDRLAKNELLVGLRPMVQDMADDDWLARAPLDRALDAMRANGLVFDALVRPRHLSRLLAFVDRNHDLPIVLDHCAKPDIRNFGYSPWLADIEAVAERRHVTCKLSGLATEAAADWTADDLKLPAGHVIGAFGAERVLWGSDWPVLNLAGGYDRWRAATMTLLAEMTGDQRAAILGGNAGRIYLARRGRRA
jgi:L-fuconolactonase